MTTATEAPVAEILERAAQILEERGWTQGRYGADSIDIITAGPHCAIGAIATAYGDSDKYLRSEAELVLAEFLGLEYGDVEPWNDEEGRTAGEVIAALRAAAEANR